MKRFEGYKVICDYLNEQRKLCIDQTGCDFCVEDLIGHFDADDFQEMYGKYDLDLNDILNYLLVYYDKKGNVRETDLV